MLNMRIFKLFLLSSFLLAILSYLLIFNTSSTSILSPIAASAQLKRPTPSLTSPGNKATFADIDQDKVKNYPKKQISILILGLDGRLSQAKSHCDAIHMVVFDLENEKIVIHPVTRGTIVNLEGIERQRSYLANVCSIYGVDTAKKYIESMLKISADYTVKVGFSQAIGIFRQLGLSPYQTLKFIRNRRYAIGDHQRSYNQALFLKDALGKYLEKIVSLPKPLVYILYQTVDADMPFDQALNLANYLAKKGFYKEPESVKIIPFIPKKSAEVHYLEQAEEKTDNPSRNAEFKAYQDKVENYLISKISKASKLYEKGNKIEALATLNQPFQKKAWLQLENPEKRLNYHFQLVKLIYLSHNNRQEAENIVFDFYTQMKAEKEKAYLKKAAEILGIER